MEIVYYPKFRVDDATSSLYRDIHTYMKRDHPQQYLQMKRFLDQVERLTLEEVSSFLLEESKKPWKQRRVSYLGDELYEYRGSQSKSGTIRLYFRINDSRIRILDAECKTDDENKIERAKKRN